MAVRRVAWKGVSRVRARAFEEAAIVVRLSAAMEGTATETRMAILAVALEGPAAAARGTARARLVRATPGAGMGKMRRWVK